MDHPKAALQYLTYIILVWSFIITGAGIIRLSSNFTDGLAIIAVGLGFLAAGFALRSENLMHEIRLGEIDQKIAMLYSYGGSDAQRKLSDIQALERYTSSVTYAQAKKIFTEGTRVVNVELKDTPTEAEEARRALNRILSRFKMTV